jgi:hypothetical protein
MPRRRLLFVSGLRKARLARWLALLSILSLGLLVFGFTARSADQRRASVEPSRQVVPANESQNDQQQFPTPSRHTRPSHWM